MERTTIPLALIWGMADPISGKPIFDFARTRLKNSG